MKLDKAHIDRFDNLMQELNSMANYDYERYEHYYHQNLLLKALGKEPAFELVSNISVIRDIPIDGRLKYISDASKRFCYVRAIKNSDVTVVLTGSIEDPAVMDGSEKNSILEISYWIESHKENDKKRFYELTFEELLERPDIKNNKDALSFVLRMTPATSDKKYSITDFYSSYGDLNDQR